MTAPRRAYQQQALMPGNEDKVGYWLTPPDLMARLQGEFHFDFDACPYPRPAGFDGLTSPWGRRNYVNPPFEGPACSPTAWTHKMLAEREKGNTSVMVYVVDRWMLRLLEAGVEIRPMKPFRWLKPSGRPQPRPRPQALFILRGKGGEQP